MRSHRLLADYPPNSKTYATVERAAAEAEKLLAKVQDDSVMRYTIGAVVIKGAARFVPVFHPSESQVQWAISFAHNPGFPFVRM